MDRRHVVRAVALAAALVVLAACGSSSKKSAATTTTAASSTTQPLTSSTVKSKKVPAKLRLLQNVKLGKIIVNTAGKTVYMYVPDGSSQTSKVPNALRATWPRVLSAGNLTVGPGLDKSKIAQYKQPNGKEQVSYSGHLLYTFKGDKKPGQANGQGLGGVWYVVSANGDKVS
jgi:predicted lipoprotein with Yx(FWY)xxD motif